MALAGLEGLGDVLGRDAAELCWVLRVLSKVSATGSEESDGSEDLNQSLSLGGPSEAVGEEIPRYRPKYGRRKVREFHFYHDYKPTGAGGEAGAQTPQKPVAPVAEGEVAPVGAPTPTPAGRGRRAPGPSGLRKASSRAMGVAEGAPPPPGLAVRGVPPAGLQGRAGRA